MSNGKKQDSSATQSSKSAPKPPKGYEAWFEEYKWMKRLAAKGDTRGQTDTYWHTRLKELEAAFKYYDLEVPNG